MTPWWFLCQACRSFGLSQSSCVRCSFDAGLALFGTSRNHRIIGMTAWKIRFFNVHNGLTQTPCRVTPSDSWFTNFGARDAIARSITSRRYHSYRGGSGVEDNHFLLVLQKLSILFNLSPVGEKSLMHWCRIVARQKKQIIYALRFAANTTVAFLPRSGTRINRLFQLGFSHFGTP